MHATFFLSAIALLPFALAAPQGPPRGPPFRLPRPVRDRQNDANTTTPEAPSCDLSGVAQPPSGLTPPAAGLSLVLVALGRGTQNYTCGVNSTAAPSAFGAVAQLFNASCTISSNPSADTISLAAAPDTPMVGQHYFTDLTTPDFDVVGLGNTQAKKAEEALAPQPSADVKWLRLEAQASSTSAVKQIYRLNTVGGLAPSNCEGKAEGEVVTVAYEAQYWIYA